MKKTLKDLTCNDFQTCEECPFKPYCHQFGFSPYDTFGEVVENMMELLPTINLDKEVEVKEDEV